MTGIDRGDSFDAFAQRVAVALRDHADATRAMPDIEAMRAMLEAACRAAPAATDVRAGTVARPPARVLAAAACSLLVLGGIGVVTATGDRGSAAPTEVADESLLADARRATTAPLGDASPSSTVPVPAPVVAELEVPATTAPVPSTTEAPPSTSLVVAAVSNDLQIAPTTTVAPRPPVTAPPSTDPAPPAPEVPAPTSTAKPPKATTVVVRTTTTASPYPFTMKQRWKTSSASPPYEEFSGTAQPGATITITSSYGGGTAVAGPTGAWAARVEFPTAPVGTKFTGKVKTAQGQKSFTFTRTSA